MWLYDDGDWNEIDQFNESSDETSSIEDITDQELLTDEDKQSTILKLFYF